MTRRFMGAVAVGVLAAAAMVTGPIAAASATDLTLKHDLIRAVPKIERSEVRLAAATKHFESTGSSAHLLAAGKAEDHILYGLRSELRRTAASTTRGANAKREMSKGLRLILDSNYAFNTQLRTGHITLKGIKADQKLAERGSIAFRDGTRLLLRT